MGKSGAAIKAGRRNSGVKLRSEVSTHAKRQNPSRIQAQRVPTWSAEPLPFGTFEPAKNKAGWVGWQALVGLT